MGYNSLKNKGLNDEEILEIKSKHSDKSKQTKENFIKRDGNILGLEKFNELWNYCEGNWIDRKIAEIEHDGYFEDGLPINPIVVGIREVSV